MNILEVDISSLIPDPANARKHSEKNLAAIKGSLARFGQQKPIVVSEKNVVVAGNGTLEAAKSLGWTKIRILKTNLKGSDLTAFGIADNRTGELAEWDPGNLSALLASLKEEDFDLGSIGFDDADLDAMIADTADPVEPGCDEDEVPAQAETRCKPGDLWILGNHRLLCGDSTNVQHVDRLMNGEKADMVFTDPPYGMNLDTDYSYQKNSDGRHSKKSQSATYRPVIQDDQDFDPRFLLEFFKEAREHFWFGSDYYRKSLPDGGSWIVWDKRTPASSETNFDAVPGSCFELCWSRDKHKRDIARILHCGLYSVENDKRQHPTQKPVKLAEWFFERWGKPDDLVADLFLGSGSTLIACEKTGRRCYGMEIDPHYCDVILARWEKYSGKEANLE